MDTPPLAGRCADTTQHHRSDDARHALDAVAPWLSCPHCAGPLCRHTRIMRCRCGHTFDIARTGHLSLLPGRRRHRGDTPAMVAAREAFLAGDHYRPLRSTITALTVEHAPAGIRLVVDLAGGTGHYLAPVLDALPAAHGMTVDLSTAALRRAARSHPRAAAIAADVWAPLPLATGSTGVALSVFGPRNSDEVARILTGDGILLVASARPEHLHELRTRIGGIGVDPHKAARHRAAFTGFVPVARQVVQWRLVLHPDEAAALASMGPSAHHRIPDPDAEVVPAELPDLVGVTAAMDVVVYRRR